MEDTAVGGRQVSVGAVNHQVMGSQPPLHARMVRKAGICCWCWVVVSLRRRCPNGFRMWPSYVLPRPKS